ncbi:helix-turn-helix domain-containing protein [Halostella pelagica]|uniref:helix-turn-helix domain-containing protein n=1 Tax=Halostella pelagica TaxID=2583824 RepID=UPI001080A31C|nr:helix-turn-helix domain-containing protein [Halostella pelagica]
MGLLAEYEITCEGLPFVEVAAIASESTLELEFHPSEDWYAAFIVQVVDGDRETVERAFESVPFVEEYVQVKRADETPWYRVRPAHGMEAQLGGYVDDVSELQALAAADMDLERIRVTPKGWIQSGWFADRETIEEFRSFWGRNGGFTLRRLTPDGGSGPAGKGLTDCQREALVTAHEMGYFDIPRRASLEDVAGELDISASSLSERLRRAQSTLVEATVTTTIRP